MAKNKNVKDLQQLTEAAGDSSTLEWSTISHTHGGNAALENAVNAPIETMVAFDITSQLQQLAEAVGDATTLEWSTISHTHAKR